MESDVTQRLPPTQEEPETETLEPIRPDDRLDNVLPRQSPSVTDDAPPTRDAPIAESDEPIATVERMDAELPNRAISNTERTAPPRIALETEIPDPTRTNADKDRHEEIVPEDDTLRRPPTVMSPPRN